MAKVKEPPEELERQKEDIQNLLSSLEAGFAEGSITQEHYNEVKIKNQEKLDEINRKLKLVEKQVQKEALAEKQLVEKAGKEIQKEAEKEAKKAEPGPAESPPKEGAEKEKKPGILGEISSKMAGEKEISEERLKEKIIMELSPKMEKLNVRFVKLKAFVDAMKEDKTGERESSQRVNEELGEARSTLGSMEGRLGEMEMKLEDVSETLTDLKPQRFAKEIQKKEEEIKLHEARLEKLDDMNTNILKRVNQIQILLEKLGNIESIADMTKDISKKLVSIDDREKKITRLADKIDNMFVEINKRLEEFMFYKAKQDSLDDLSKEMLKSMDELTTKLTRYAEKDDLELLRDTMDNKISTLTKEGGAPAPTQLSQEQSEMESFMKLLEEQYRKGLISKKDYEKARDANVQKTGTTAPQQKAPQATPAAEAKGTVIEQTPPVEEEPEPTTGEKAEPKPQEEGSGLEQAAKIAQPPETPAPEEAVQKPIKEGRRQESPSGKESKKQTQAKPAAARNPAKTVTREEIAKKIAGSRKEPAKPRPADTKPELSAEKPEKQEKSIDKRQKMLADLDYSLRKGIISQKAYENAQKIIMNKKF
jgi:hypothetical protein